MFFFCFRFSPMPFFTGDFFFCFFFCPLLGVYLSFNAHQFRPFQLCVSTLCFDNDNVHSFLLFLANTEHLNFCKEFDAVGFVFTGHVSVISSMCIKPHCQPEYFSIYIQILIVPLFSVGKHFFILRGINSVEKIKTKTKWDKKNNHPKWMPLLGINLSKYQFDGTFNNAGIFILLR